MFDGVHGTGDLGHVHSNGQPAGKGQVLRIGNIVTVVYEEGRTEVEEEAAVKAREGRAVDAAAKLSRVVLEWVGGSEADMIADAVVAVVLQAAGQPPGVCTAELQRHKALQAGDVDGAMRAELGLIAALMGAQYGPSEVDSEQGIIFVKVDDRHVIIDARSGKVQCADEVLRRRVEKSLSRLNAAMHPCELGTEA